MKIDPTSDRVVLFYTGNEAGEPAISGVPARDLTENDIARLLDIEHRDGDTGQPVELRGAARDGAVGKLVDRLAEGPYRRTAPESPKPRARAAAVHDKDFSVTVTPPPPPAASVSVVSPAEPSADQPKEA